MIDTIDKIDEPLTAQGVAQFVEAFTGHLSDEQTITAGQLRESLTKSLTRALAPTQTARAELEAAGVPKHTIDNLYPTALQQMVKKVDERPAGHGGYIAYRDELIAILSELSKRVPASVLVEGHRQGLAYKEEDGIISIEVNFGITLERGAAVSHREVVAARPDSRYSIVRPRGGENMLDDWHERMDDAVALWFDGASDEVVRNAMRPNPHLMINNRLY